MAQFFVNRYTFGMWQTNCYMVGNVESRKIFIIDPGQYGLETLQATIEKDGLELEAILLTHGHLDHTWSAPQLARVFPDTSIRIHHEDTWMWDDPPAAISTPRFQLDSVGYEWDIDGIAIETFSGNDTMTLAGTPITVLHTPGHTRGSSSFVSNRIGDDPIMFSGDFLFAGSIGRTDLPSGSVNDMHMSLKTVALVQPDHMVVAPGHGELSTIGHEKQTNEYLRSVQ